MNKTCITEKKVQHVAFPFLLFLANPVHWKTDFQIMKYHRNACVDKNHRENKSVLWGHSKHQNIMRKILTIDYDLPVEMCG